MDESRQWSYQTAEQNYGPLTQLGQSAGGPTPKPGGNKFSFEPIKQFFKSKPGKFLLYGIGYLVFAWIFINIFIGPVNRILGLPKVNNLENYSPISSIEVYDKNDQFVTVLQGEEDRQVVSLKDVSTSLKQALFASEDRDFYRHGGINFGGIFRAVLINLKSGRISQGGSTITQQLVKNIFFSPKEWGQISRKFKEALLTIEVEKKYTKDQILEIYLNQIYWGKGAYGVERAAKRYFNKNSADLNVAESAYLVALLPSPSTLHNSKQAYERQKNIIKNMVRYGYITKTQARDALSYPLKFESDSGNLSKHPYYMSVVLDELRARFSEQELRHSGLKVYTAIDQEAQTQAEAMLSDGIKRAPAGISQGALVTIDVPSNEVRVIVGGVGDFWKHQWNRATSVHTIGSAFKPFVYLAAFMKGLYSSNSLIVDSPFVYRNSETGEVWAPKNFDSKFWGEITIRKALVNSRNIPAIRVAQKVGMPTVQEVAEKVGINNTQPYLSSALGSSAVSPLRAANAYAVLARGGIYMKPVIIKRITERGGKIIEQNNPVPEKVLPPGPIYELIDILVDVVDHGTGVQAKIPGLQIAGKTGTADGSRDVWFIGFTPDTVTALWGGNDKNQKASSAATGGVVMASIWKKFMTSYYTINPTPVTFFQKPAERVRLLIDPITGLLATRDTFQPEYREFVPGTEPTKYAPPPSPEQIEEYLREREQQRRTMQDDSEEEIEDPENLEEQLVNNPNDSPSAGPQAGRELNQPIPLNQQDNLSAPPVRPVLIPRDEPPQPQPNNSQMLDQRLRQQQVPVPQEQPTRRRRLFFRRSEEATQPIDTQGQPVPPQQPKRWRKIFSSPY
jgi:penicillin-binding protein 1A